MSFPRQNTRRLWIGPIPVGRGAPISVQSMNNTPTADVAATLAQLQALAEAGAEIGRLAVPDQAAAAALPEIVRQSPLPLVADIHFDYRLALASVAAGMAGLRLNPGNINGPDKVRQVAAAAKAAGIPIRVGVNGGSLPKDILAREGGVTPAGLCEAALRQAELLEDAGFSAIKLSLKCSDLPTMLAAYRKIAQACDYPLHIGVTEAGTLYHGSVKNAIGIGSLLSQGIGDTLRVSLTADPVQEVLLGREILSLLGIRRQGWEFISCPTCGRTKMDLIPLATRIEEELAAFQPRQPRRIAVMGCAVNGPGEAADADLGLACGVNGGVIFRQGQSLGAFSEADLLPAFLRLAQELAREE